MAITKKLGHGIKLISAKTFRKRIPLMVNWAITGRCNLRCTHCYGAYGVMQKDELTKEQIFKIIDELESLGTRRITIEGGEPLVRKDIGEIINYIHQKGIEQSLCTNGVLLERKINEIKGKVDIVILSIDGAESAHDKIRGQGNFKQVLHAIEVAKQYNLRTLIF
ncbi:MAG: radical SAM protein, partial [bacterium]|nr:radical SAM protein [bacterium]